MSRFDDYAGKYSHIRTERREGVLEITFHTEGRTMAWGLGSVRGNWAKPFTTSVVIAKTNSSS